MNNCLKTIVSVILSAFAIQGCTNDYTNQSLGNQAKQSLPYLSCQNNLIIIDYNDDKTHELLLKVGDMESKITSMGRTDTIEINNHIDIRELAYLLVTQPQVTIKVIIDNNIDTTFVYQLPIYQQPKYTASLVSGKAAKLYSNKPIPYNTSELKKWLYNSGRYMDDSKITNMQQLLQRIETQNPLSYYTDPNETIPILKNFNGVKYKVSSDLKADYYYLFATDNPNDIKDFISETIGDNFSNSEKSINKELVCFRSLFGQGYLTIFLIGINNDWSSSFVPIGVVGIDFLPPHITSDNDYSYFIPTKSFSFDHKTKSSWKLVFPDIDSNYIFSDNNTLNESFPKIYIDNRQFKATLGTVRVSTNPFYGDNASFTISFSGDVKTISIKREASATYWRGSGTKTINVENELSPISFSYELNLNLGDNYIPITATDKMGNSSTINYKITMEPRKPNNTGVTIDNNINIWN